MQKHFRPISLNQKIRAAVQKCLHSPPTESLWCHSICFVCTAWEGCVEFTLITLCRVMKFRNFKKVAFHCNQGNWSCRREKKIHVQLQQMFLKWSGHSFCYLLRWKQVRNQVCRMKGTPSRAWCVRTLWECWVTGSVLVSYTILHSGHTAASRDLFTESPAVPRCPQYFSFTSTCSAASCLTSN